MNPQQEICAFCNMTIGQYDQACVLNGKIACAMCDRKLRTEDRTVDGKKKREELTFKTEHTNTNTARSRSVNQAQVQGNQNQKTRKPKDELKYNTERGDRLLGMAFFVDSSMTIEFADIDSFANFIRETYNWNPNFKCFRQVIKLPTNVGIRDANLHCSAWMREKIPTIDRVLVLPVNMPKSTASSPLIVCFGILTVEKYSEMLNQMSVAELNAMFEIAVDVYLTNCRRTGSELTEQAILSLVDNKYKDQKHKEEVRQSKQRASHLASNRLRHKKDLQIILDALIKKDNPQAAKGIQSYLKEYKRDFIGSDWLRKKLMESLSKMTEPSAERILAKYASWFTCRDKNERKFARDLLEQINH